MGLIYGMGHAVYTISDPRQIILKGAVQKLAKAEGYDEDFELYERVERLAPQVIGKSVRFIKALRPMSIFTAACFTVCLTFLVSFIHRCSLQPELQVGAHTDLRKS